MGAKQLHALEQLLCMELDAAAAGATAAANATAVTTSMALASGTATQASAGVQGLAGLLLGWLCLSLFEGLLCKPGAHAPWGPPSCITGLGMGGVRVMLQLPAHVVAVAREASHYPLMHAARCVLQKATLGAVGLRHIEDT